MTPHRSQLEVVARTFVYRVAVLSLFVLFASGCGTRGASPDDGTPTSDATATDAGTSEVVDGTDVDLNDGTDVQIDTFHDSNDTSTDAEPERACPASSWTDEQGELQYCLCVQPRHGGTDTYCCARNVAYSCHWRDSHEGSPISRWSGGGECWPEGSPSIIERFSTPCPWVDHPMD